MRQQRPKSYGFTITKFVKSNQEYLDICDKLMRVRNYRDRYIFIIIAFEFCPTTGKPHLQGYIYLKEKRTVNAVMQLFPASHIEIAREGPAKNFAYCAKTGVFKAEGCVEHAIACYEYEEFMSKKEQFDTQF